ncbi:MAG: CZB domain-containing protein [Leptospiraceae bacterium]|nr:CZB domain-containing protein [Leptospiraceae bacterium]
MEQKKKEKKKPTGWFGSSHEQWMERNRAALVESFLRGATDVDGALGRLLVVLSSLRDLVVRSGDDLAVSLMHFPEILEMIEKEQGEFRNAAADQMERTKDLATVAEELDAVAHEIARGLERGRASAESARSGGASISEGIGNIHTLTRSIADRSQRIRSINDSLGHEMHGLGEVLKEVEKQTEQVKGLSEQTNMLALNASIEAARAGEYGHGFAVVADGVSDLAAKSSEAVKSIERALESMNRQFESWADRAVGQMQETNEINASVQGLERIVEGNTKSVKEVQAQIDASTDLYLELDAQIHEINKTTSLISDSAQQINARADYIHEAADHIRNDIGKLDGMVNQSVEKITNQNPEWLIEFLKRRRRDHLKWMTEVDAALTANEAGRFPQLDHRKCNMGLWLYMTIVTSEGQQVVHNALEDPHRRLHECAASMARLVSDGHLEGARAKRSELTAIYEEIAVLFDRYEAFLEKQVLDSVLGES